MARRESQGDRIRRYLENGGALTSGDALQLFGCSRLAGRIYDLKQTGFPIDKRMIDTGSGASVAQYRMGKAAGND